MKNLAIIVVVIILIVAGFAYFGGTKTTEPVETATSTDESMVDDGAAVAPIVDEATPAATGTTPAATGTGAVGQ